MSDSKLCYSAVHEDNDWYTDDHIHNGDLIRDIMMFGPDGEYRITVSEVSEGMAVRVGTRSFTKNPQCPASLTSDGTTVYGHLSYPLDSAKGWAMETFGLGAMEVLGFGSDYSNFYSEGWGVVTSITGDEEVGKLTQKKAMEMLGFGEDCSLMNKRGVVISASPCFALAVYKGNQGYHLIKLEDEARLSVLVEDLKTRFSESYELLDEETDFYGLSL